MSQTTSHGAGGEGGAIKAATGVYSRENTSTEAEDFLSTVDWVSGDVGQSTKDVLRGLLSKELKCEVSHRQPIAKNHDPRVAIEMRHKQVRLAITSVRGRYRKPEVFSQYTFKLELNSLQ